MSSHPLITPAQLKCWAGGFADDEKGYALRIACAAGRVISCYDPMPETVERPKPVTMEDIRSKAIREALEKTGGNISRAAALLQISRGQIYEWTGLAPKKKPMNVVSMNQAA